MNLRELQERATRSLLATPLAQSVLEGKLRKSEYIAYLQDVFFYALHSSQVIAIAGSRLALSHPPLAQYLFHHAAEELGHDKWAESDLLELGVPMEAISNTSPSSACLRMIGLEYFYAAHDNPVGLFGWMFVLESLGGKVGGRFASAIDSALDLNGKAMYFLKGHADADAHHSEDLVRVIDACVTAEADIRAFERMYGESISCYCQILDGARAVSQHQERATGLVYPL
jgi:heme oxygenase